MATDYVLDFAFQQIGQAVMASANSVSNAAAAAAGGSDGGSGDSSILDVVRRKWGKVQDVIQGIAAPLKRRSMYDELPEHVWPPQEHIEMSHMIQRGSGHNFLPCQLTNPTWCDYCGDFIWGLYKQCLRCHTCQYTCHLECVPAVTLHCKSISDDDVEVKGVKATGGQSGSSLETSLSLGNIQARPGGAKVVVSTGTADRTASSSSSVPPPSSSSSVGVNQPCHQISESGPYLTQMASDHHFSLPRHQQQQHHHHHPHYYHHHLQHQQQSNRSHSPSRYLPRSVSESHVFSPNSSLASTGPMTSSPAQATKPADSNLPSSGLHSETANSSDKPSGTPHPLLAQGGANVSNSQDSDGSGRSEIVAPGHTPQSFSPLSLRKDVDGQQPDLPTEKDETDSGYRSGTIPDDKLPKVPSQDTLDQQELKRKIAKYNHFVPAANIDLTGKESFQGFVKVTMNLIRPITMELGARPPSIYELLTREHIVEENTQQVAFYMPRDTHKSLHIDSETTTREVVTSLLKKFHILDHPRKFAMYEQEFNHNNKLVRLRRLTDKDFPLRAILTWDPERIKNYRMVLQENETGEIVWDAFSLPELSNFLKVLDREEKETILELKHKYAYMKQYMERRLVELRNERHKQQARNK